MYVVRWKQIKLLGWLIDWLIEWLIDWLIEISWQVIWNLTLVFQAKGKNSLKKKMTFKKWKQRLRVSKNEECLYTKSFFTPVSQECQTYAHADMMLMLSKTLTKETYRFHLGQILILKLKFPLITIHSTLHDWTQLTIVRILTLKCYHFFWPFKSLNNQEVNLRNLRLVSGRYVSFCVWDDW